MGRSRTNDHFVCGVGAQQLRIRAGCLLQTTFVEQYNYAHLVDPIYRIPAWWVMIDTFPTVQADRHKTTSAGSKERWENIGLGNCARLTSAEITVCLKESSLRELQDTRATAMSTLIPQLPVSLEKLTLRLLVGNSEWWEPYTDLMKPDWSRIGLHLSSLPRFSKLIVQLDPSKEVGGLLLHWTEIKRTVLQENMRGFTPTQGVQMISFFPPLPT